MLCSVLPTSSHWSIASSSLSYSSFHFITSIGSVVIAEEHLDRFVIERVALLLEHLELPVGRRHSLRVLHSRDGVLDAACRAQRTSDKITPAAASRLYERSTPGARAIDQVDYLVEVPGKRVNVLTVERRHKRAVDPVDRVVSEVIRLVLERLYLATFWSAWTDP